LESNQDTWDGKIRVEKQRRDSEGKSAPLTFSSVGKDEVEQAQRAKRQSEPTVVPIETHAPSSPFRRQAVRTEDGPSAHPAEEKRKAAVGYSTQEDGHRASAPLLATHGSPLSPTNTSRRSSKDVALEKLQQLSMFANQGFNSDSRRGSADLQFNQSFPSSRRGSKDESLTTILVSSKGSSSRGSPSKLSESTDQPTSAANKRQSVQHGQKASTTRNSVPSSRSHATSSATAATGNFHSPSTQPSSLAPTEDETQPRLATTEDPFAAPGNWPNTDDSTHRASAQEGLPSAPPIPPIPRSKQSQKGDTSPLPVSRMASGDSDGAGRQSPRKEERLGGGLRESRSRSRLRGLKFWKKKRDVSGVDSRDERETPRSSP
jgi:3',5'-cyclic-nucleotide phosphodiesterase